MSIVKEKIISQWVKIKSADLEVIKFIQDLDEDSRKNFPILFEMSCLGYANIDDRDNVIDYVYPEQVRDNLNNKYCEKITDITDGIERLRHGDSSFYAIYSTKYKKKNTTNCFLLDWYVQVYNKKGDLSKNIQTWIDRDKTATKHRVPLQEWIEIFSECHNAVSAIDTNGKNKKKLDADRKQAASKVFLNHNLNTRLVNDKSGNSIKLRPFLEQCKRPEHTIYTKILAKSQVDFFQGLFEKEKTKLKEFAEKELSITCKKQKIDAKIYKVFSDFIQEMYDLGSGISGKVLECLFNGKYDNPTTKLANELLNKKYANVIIELFSSKEVLFKYFKIWKEENHFKGLRKYAAKPNLTKPPMYGIENFKIRVLENKDIEIIMPHIGKITCYPSDYFGDISFVRDEKNYNVEFHRKYRTKKQVKNGLKISGVLKSIGLQTRDGELCVNLPINIKVIERSSLQLFLQSAQLKKVCDYLDLIPQSFVALAVDLNINDPISGVIVDAKKGDFTGQLPVWKYGSATITKGPYFLAKSGERCDEICKLISQINKLKSDIRDFKITRIGKSQEEISVARNDLQKRMRIIREAEKAIKTSLHNDGYRNIGESIQLLRLYDALRDMKKSYQSICLINNGQKTFLTFNNKRSELRKLINRRIAFCIAETAYQNKCDVVFIEDLESVYDRDLGSNSITRLLNANTLKKEIQRALDIRGIILIEVDKAGTSQTFYDAKSQQSVFGLRPRWKEIKDHGWSKSDLYLPVGDKLVCVNSDLSACLSVMMKGLGHSVEKFKFKIRPENKSDDPLDQPEEKDGSFRLKTLMEEHGHKGPIRMWETGDGHASLVKTELDEIKNDYVYYFNKQFWTNEGCKRYRDHIRDMVLAGKQIERKDINSLLDNDLCPPTSKSMFEFSETIKQEEFNFMHE